MRVCERAAGVVAGATCLAVLGGCGSPESGDEASASELGKAVTATPSPPAGKDRTTPPASASTRAPSPTRASSPLRECYDGTCEIRLSKPTDIPVDSGKFGFGTLEVTQVGDGGVTVQATTTGGVFLRSGVGGRGKAGLNNLGIEVKSVSGSAVTLVLAPR